MTLQPTRGTVDEALRRIEEGWSSGQGERTPLSERMRGFNVPGVSIALFDGGQITAARGYGVCEADGAAPVTSQTLFQAASISKPVTALAALRLAEDGRLDLDVNVSGYLRSWAVPPVGGWQPHLTVRQLLSHTAGLTVHGFPGYRRGLSLPDLPSILDGRPPANTAPVRVDTVPGVQWRYSGGGTTVLQLLLTDLTDRPFPELIRTLVLEPLGMMDSTFVQPLPEERWDEAATGHGSDGRPVPGSWHVYPEMAAAGLWTTPSDLARFALGVLAARTGRPGSIVRAQTMAEMLSPQVGDFGDAGLGFHRMGLGFFLGGEGRSMRFGHTGGNAGFRCLLVVYPEHDGGVALMTNGDNGGQTFAAVTATLAETCGWPDLRGDLGPPSEQEAANYVGEYEVRPGCTVSVTSTERGLSLTLPQQDPLVLRSLGGERFGLDLLAAAVTFRRAPDGQVAGLLLQQNLRDVPAVKTR